MPTKTVLTKSGREALAYIMAHRLGIHAWHCGAGGCHFSAAGSAELVATAKDSHAEQHRYDEDIARLGLAAMGLSDENLTKPRPSGIITPMPLAKATAHRRPLPPATGPVLRRPLTHKSLRGAGGLLSGRPLSAKKSKTSGRTHP